MRGWSYRRNSLLVLVSRDEEMIPFAFGETTRLIEQIYVPIHPVNLSSTLHTQFQLKGISVSLGESPV